VPEGYAVWLDRDVVGVTGPEAAAFLQGQLSQDVLSLGADASAWSWVLAPTGKVDALVRVTHRADGEWLLDTDAGWGEPLLARLNRFKLRTKVGLEPRPWKALGLRAAAVSPAAEVVAVEPWPGLAGLDLLGVDPPLPDGLRVLRADQYEAVRIRAGMPRMGAELDEKTIPGETGLIELTVSFTKGCYTGQELVARIDSRGGHVARRLRVLQSAQPIEAGISLIAHDGKVAGTVTSAAPAPPQGWVALGYIRRGIDVPGTLRAGPGGPEVEVRELMP
jgi:folate-binding protein YgfZ